MKHESNQLLFLSFFLIFESQMSIFSVGSFDQDIFENESKTAYFQARTFHIIMISFELHHLLNG